jgi:hypothetical protein
MLFFYVQLPPRLFFALFFVLSSFFLSRSDPVVFVVEVGAGVGVFVVRVEVEHDLLHGLAWRRRQP